MTFSRIPPHNVILSTLAPVIAFLMAGPLCHASDSATPEPLQVKIHDETLNRIDPRIFGHLLERPSWGGENGVEAAFSPEHGGLHPEVIAKLKDMRIPLLRYPDGTDVDYMQWSDLIDNAPGRNGSKRPEFSVGHQGEKVTNGFGYDEYFAFRNKLGCETILVANFFDAVLKRKPLRTAAIEALGLLAYCNADEGATLPEGMPDWPAVRARNGHPAPFKANYIQIGNETFLLFETRQDLLDKAGITNAGEWYVECIEEYVRVIREIDPKIPILIDSINPKINDAILEKVGDEISYLVQHRYTPLVIKEVTRNGKPVDAATLNDEAVWLAWVQVPGSRDELGQSTLENRQTTYARSHGRKVAVTEWNWNGSWKIPPPAMKTFDPEFAKAIGAAGFLNAFVRSDVVEIACQSLLIGKKWNLVGLEVDPTFEKSPRWRPTAMVVDFYAKHIGDRRLRAEIENLPAYVQPYRMGWILPATHVAYVDLVVSRDAKNLYVHAINRRFREAQPIRLDLSAFATTREASQIVFAEAEPGAEATPQSTSVTVKEDTLSATLPERSITCFVIPLNPLP